MWDMETHKLKPNMTLDLINLIKFIKISFVVLLLVKIPV